MLPHKMRIVIAIMDELINTQLLASRAESTHSDSAYPFVGLSIFTEGLHRKILTRTWKIHLKKMLNDLHINMYQQIQTGIGAICKNFHFQQRMLYSWGFLVLSLGMRRMLPKAVRSLMGLVIIFLNGLPVSGGTKIGIE